MRSVASTCGGTRARRSVEALARPWDVGGGVREGIRQKRRGVAVGGVEERAVDGPPSGETRCDR